LGLRPILPALFQKLFLFCPAKWNVPICHQIHPTINILNFLVNHIHFRLDHRLLQTTFNFLNKIEVLIFMHNLQVRDKISSASSAPVTTFLFFTRFAYPQAGILSFFEADDCNFNDCGFDGSHGSHDLSNFSNLMMKKSLPPPLNFKTMTQMWP
jgi:hypothetical protein